jgi:hypothetical protein
MPIDDETHAEVIKLATGLAARLERLEEALGLEVDAHRREDLSDEELGKAFDRIAELPLDEKLDMVLGLMKTVKMHATGKAYLIQQYANAAVSATLYALDEEATQAAFERWFEALELEELDDLASSAETEKLLERFRDQEENDDGA